MDPSSFIPGGMSCWGILHTSESSQKHTCTQHLNLIHCRLFQNICKSFPIKCHCEIMVVSLFQIRLLYTVCFFKEEDYEWGSQSILDALPSINSQQKRLAVAAMRWRKSLQGHTDKEVLTLPFHIPGFLIYISDLRPSLNSSIPSLGCIWWLDSDVEHRPGQRCRIQKIAAVWRCKGLLQFKVSWSGLQDYI